jgi:hypothetical protein
MDKEKDNENRQRKLVLRKEKCNRKIRLFGHKRSKSVNKPIIYLSRVSKRNVIKCVMKSIKNVIKII